MKKEKIISILLCLTLLIPELATATRDIDEKPVPKSSRRLEPYEFLSVKNGEFSCWNNYSLDRGTSVMSATKDAVYGSGILIGLAVKTWWVILPIIAITLPIECYLTYMEYDILRDAIIPVQGKMTEDELADFIVEIGEARFKSKDERLEIMFDTRGF